MVYLVGDWTLRMPLKVYCILRSLLIYLKMELLFIIVRSTHSLISLSRFISCSRKIAAAVNDMASLFPNVSDCFSKIPVKSGSGNLLQHSFLFVLLVSYGGLVSRKILTSPLPSPQPTPSTSSLTRSHSPSSCWCFVKDFLVD